MPLIVYVSNADSGDISVLALDAASGELTPLQTLALGGMLMPMALAPDRQRLYVARRSEPLAAVSLAIDPHSGLLTRIGEGRLPHSMANIATDRSGCFLFSASYGGHLIAVSPIGADGVVRPAQQVLPTGPHAHAIHADPSNRFVFATSLGGGVVMQFHFNAATGALTPNDTPELRMREGAGPRHFVFGAGDAPRFVYLLNELDASVDVLAFDSSRGTLAPVQSIGSLPPGFSGEPWAADLHLTPDGRFLYSSERRSSTVARFAVDATSGRLTALGHEPTQTQPRGMRVTPDGRHLLVVGQLSNRISCYAIDSGDGRLAQRSETAVGVNPNWIEVVALRERQRSVARE